MKRVLQVLGVALVLGGCGPRYQAVSFSVRSEPPTPVRVEYDEIEIPVGIAVAVHAELQSSSSIEYVEDDHFDLVSEDRDILLSEATAGTNNWVLVGVGVGETCLSVIVDFEEEECIPVRVTAE